MHILLIEPDAALAASYQAALEADGHTVTWARASQQAVFSAEEHAPDAVVMEIEMARHNGIEFLYEFKSYTEWQPIPVIILTGLPVQELEALGVLRTELGVVKVLSKTHTNLQLLRDEVALLGQQEQS